MAGYSKHGTNYGKLGNKSDNNRNNSEYKRTPAYSSAYSGASYVHFIQEKK